MTAASSATAATSTSAATAATPATLATAATAAEATYQALFILQCGHCLSGHVQAGLWVPDDGIMGLLQRKRLTAAPAEQINLAIYSFAKYSLAMYTL